MPVQTNDVFVFDVDGTLTQPRVPMTLKFAEFFRVFAAKHHVYLVSGSDIGKIEEQIPKHVLRRCRGIFGASGCEFRVGDTLVYRKQHDFDPKMIKMLEEFISISDFPYRTGNHIERRAGMINVSVVGRNATKEQRREYNHWDNARSERRALRCELQCRFPQYEVTAGGEISVDITPSGWNKSMVYPVITQIHPGCGIQFFGDRMGPEGNDFPLAHRLASLGRAHGAHQVHGPEDTKQHLLRFMAPEKLAHIA